MRQITDIEIKKRLAFENPWWDDGVVEPRFRDWPRRAYFDGFMDLVQEKAVNRAVILMGPRRVGKTVMIQQGVQKLLDDGVAAKNIVSIAVDTPVFTGISLENLLGTFMEMHGHGRRAELYVFFDEIQYHPDWERHLKSLVDSYPDIRFVASGSAAAALKMKSRESGAGRFTDFILPPLTFKEFIRFRGLEKKLFPKPNGCLIDKLNDAFIDYLNFGGFPEAVIEEAVRGRMDRYVADDIIDKVLLRDIPSLYGIRDPQELKRFFSVLAYNTGQEVSLDELSQSSQVAKNTLKKYLDYLEAAFLICRVYRVDANARRFKRQTHFKVYLTNPCLRAALFGAVGPEDEAMGWLAETAMVAQYVHNKGFQDLYYARWKTGRTVREVDLVFLQANTQKACWAEEIKWSDRAYENPMEELAGPLEFVDKSKPILGIVVTTRTKSGAQTINGGQVLFYPVSLWCYGMAEAFVENELRAGRHPMTGKSFRIDTPE